MGTAPAAQSARAGYPSVFYYSVFLRLFQQIAAAVLNGLSQVGGLDALAAVQVGDGAGHAENAVMAAARQAQPVEGPFMSRSPAWSSRQYSPIMAGVI